MKKTLCTILAFCLLLSVAASAYEVPRISVSRGASTESNHYNSGESHDYILMPDTASEVAQRFSVPNDRSITDVTVVCHSYGNSIGSITLTLYQWDSTLSASKKGEPIARQTFENYSDGNTKLSLSVTKKDLSGDFVLVLSDPVEKVGPYTTSYTKDTLFADGVEVPNKTIEMMFSTTQKTVAVDPEDAANKAVDPYTDIDMMNFIEAKNYSTPEFVWTDGVKRQGFNASSVGYYAYYVDFGNVSPKGAQIEVFGNTTASKQAQIILDDLDSGTVLCTFPILPTESLQETINAAISVQNITGIHKIFFVLDNGFSVTTFKFTKETPEKNRFEKMVDEFKASNNFTLKSTYSDTWTATDMLGRKLADNSTAGDYNPDKQVGLFYWTWHQNLRSEIVSAGINQHVIDLYPGAESEIKNKFTYKDWSEKGYWNESVYGVYNGKDEWVMRKQLELFAAAGVDGLFFDATNGTTTYDASYLRLAQEMHKMHKQGIQTPGMAFMLPFFDKDYNVTDLDRLYENFYAVGLYSDCWYYWDGKPVVMGYPDNLSKSTGDEGRDAQHKEILDFFTFRPGQPSYFTGPQRDDHWPWLELYPQNPYGTSEKYGCECVSVGVAMNATPEKLTAMNDDNVLGRSYTYKDGFSKYSETSVYYGYNFQEQWDRAFELNPEFVFVTGWNEWSAGHYDEWQGVNGAYPDQYSDEYSRDLEPTKGEFKDSYYYLFANNIRKFKGVRPTPAASAEKTISLDGGFDQWADVGPEFIGYAGGTEPRNSVYNLDFSNAVNTTGRNDIVLSKVARDSDNLYFYVETADVMSDPSGNAWMQLFINTDRKYKTGWEGYDFVLNRVSPTSSTAVLEKWTGTDNVLDWKWEKVSDVSYALSGNKMMIAIPRNILGVTNAVDIEFKWNDNMQVKGDIMDFYTNGDTAPVGRYNYHYVEEGANKAATDEPVDPANLLTHKIKKFVVLALDNNYAYKFGSTIKIDDQSDITAPMIINDKTMVPVRFIAETLGATVKWNDDTKTVTIAKEGYSRLSLTLNSNIMKVEKEKVTLQSPATEVDNRIYVPLRDIVEALEMNCYWVDPGIIIIGTNELAYASLFVNGGIEQLFNVFNMA